MEPLEFQSSFKDEKFKDIYSQGSMNRGEHDTAVRP